MYQLIRFTATGQVGPVTNMSVHTVILTSAAAAATAVLHDSNTNNNPVLSIACPINDTRAISLAGSNFTRGVYVELTGAGAAGAIEVG